MATNNPAGPACHCCGADIPPTPPGHAGGTGYALDKDGNMVCYACCAEDDRQHMRNHGRITLYLNEETAIVCNWPGTLQFKAVVRKGRRNTARTRTDVWFRDGDGARWWGVGYGDNTQIVHCKRLK